MSTNSTLVSIIMPVYNKEQYIGMAIDSVMQQSHKNFELIIVNDGSKDRSEGIIKNYSDSRIRYYEQENLGVSNARNVGLNNMRGDFFCFLDADDILPPNSLKSRLDIFQLNTNIDFVDGVVHYFMGSKENIIQTYTPDFQGEVYRELVKLNEKCLFGNTWMIKRNSEQKYLFNTQLTHAEDLAFYLSISKNKGIYNFTTEPVLFYRQTNNSAMSDGKGLEKGYKSIYTMLKSERDITLLQLFYLKYKITRIMFLSYLFDYNKPSHAIKVLLKFPFL